jgi:hypothetical protein
VRTVAELLLLILILLQGKADALAGLSTLQQDKGNTVQGADEAGPFVIGNGRDRSKKESDVRDFLWSHWRQRRSGHFVATWISKEGRTSNTTYVCEKDEHGVWSLVVTTEWPPTEGNNPTHDAVKFRVYAVRRIEPRHDGQSPATFISDEERRSGDTYRLVFFDEKGKETGGV